MRYAMKYLFKCTFLLLTIGTFSLGGRVTPNEIIIFLIFIALNIFREKYINSIYIIAVEFILVCIGASLNPYFLVLNGIITFDLFYKKYHYGIIPIIVSGIYVLRNERLFEYMFLISLCAYFAYVSKSLEERNEAIRSVYDKERKYRYELEDAKSKLLRSSREVAHIAEVKERNRIARSLHDNIGHSIAGILFQLQAALKLRGKNDDKSYMLLKKSVEELSSSLELLRDTVHNIRPRESLGVEYIREIIDNFSFCPVEFILKGDFNCLGPSHVEIICTNIKEALTNASKYSCATKVYIQIDINDKFTRLYIKDNGVGCPNIIDNLGLSGMKERLKNIGGSISISGGDGFLIVCILPREAGGGVFEGINNG
jgi:signal transduction histidine kinase